MRIFVLFLICAQWLNAQSFLSTLERPEDFEKLSGAPLVQKYGQTRAVKIVFDLSTEKLYFINGKNYPYHYSFCRDYLNYRKELTYFNEHNYSDSAQRDYLLANLNHFGGQDQYAMEIGASDKMRPTDILRLYELIRVNTFVGDSLYFFINSDRLQKETEALQQHLPILLPAAVYQNQVYQPISNAKTYGTLRFIRDFKTEKDRIAGAAAS